MAMLHEEHSKHSSRSNGEFAGKVRETREAVSQAAHKITEAATSLYEKMDQNVRDQTTEYRDALTQYVRKKPLAALGSAVLMGAGLAILLRRRRR